LAIDAAFFFLASQSDWLLLCRVGTAGSRGVVSQRGSRESTRRVPWVGVAVAQDFFVAIRGCCLRGGAGGRKRQRGIPCCFLQDCVPEISSPSWPRHLCVIARAPPAGV